MNYLKLLNDLDEIRLSQEVDPRFDKSVIKKLYIKWFYDDGVKKALVMVVNQKGDVINNKTMFLSENEEYFEKHLKIGKIIYRKGG